MNLPFDLVIYGSQGSGKTTQAKALAKKFQSNLFLTGEVMRNLAQDDPDIREDLRQGNLISDEIFLAELEKFLSSVPSIDHIVFEGVVRNPQQENPFINIMRQHGRSFKIIFIEVSPGEALHRLELRRQNHEQDRNDEEEKALQRRLSIFHEQTLPAIEQFRKDGFEIITINGDVPPDEVTEQIVSTISHLS